MRNGPQWTYRLAPPIMRSARGGPTVVLRSLRLSGRVELVEEQISSADHVWVVMRSLVERAKADDRGAELVERMRDRASRWSANPFVSNVFKSLAARPLPQPDPPPVSVQSLPPNGASDPTRMTVEEAVRALSDGAVAFKSPIVLESLTAEGCARLGGLLEPRNDTTVLVRAATPSVRFTRAGHSIGGAQSEHRDNRRDLRMALRPALAAGNRFGIPLPWHRPLLTNESYVQGLIACLSALDDADRFYDQLAQAEDAFMPFLSDALRLTPVLKFVDARIIPFLTRHARTGTDAVLEAWCAIAARIQTPEIDGVLAALFQRWTHRFEGRRRGVQHSENHALWRAFRTLSGHPRFRSIEAYDLRLMAIAYMQIRWFHKDDIVRVLQACPRAYSHIEAMLFKSAPYECYFNDEVERLDEAADALFGRLAEVVG